MFVNGVEGIDMEALHKRVARSVADLAAAPPDGGSGHRVPLPLPPREPANPAEGTAAAKPSLARRLRQFLDPLRGRRMRDAEKALFWARIEGLAGDVRMMGFRLTEEAQAHGAAHVATLDSLHRELAARDRIIARLQGDLQFQRRRLNRLDRDGTAPYVPAPSPAKEQSGNDIYLAFEERFRGPVAEIKERLRPHLDRVRAHPTLSAGRPLLDIGCGRGEWLELLTEGGVEAYGVDTNAHAVAFSAQRGLQALTEDALDHLGRLPNGALGAITIFHVIEHLPLEILLKLLEEARRTLVPGGLLLLETPNPESIKVGATTFHYDPTHLRPIPPQLAEFLVGMAGFADIEVVRLNPYPASSLVKEESETAFRLNELMFGPQDYAIVARKA